MLLEWYITTGRVACPFVQKVVLPKKDRMSWTIKGCFCDKEWTNCCSSRNLSDSKDTDMSTVSQHRPKKDKCEVRCSPDLEKKLYNQGWTNREHKRIHVLLPACLEQVSTRISSKHSNEQDIIQTWKPLHQQSNCVGWVNASTTHPWFNSTLD